MDAMSLRHHILDNADAVAEAERAEAAARLSEGSVPTVLVQSDAAARRMRRAFADGPCALGVRVATLGAWTADRWELVGDGRRLVSSVERALLVRRALDEQPRTALEGTPGTVDLLARLAREALPWLLPSAVPAEVPLSAAEQEALSVLERYAALLAERGLCEESQAAALLPDALGADVPPLVLAGVDDMGCAHERLTAALAERGDVLRLDDGCRAPSDADARSAELRDVLGRLFRPVASDPVEPRGNVRFLLPAGRYAEPRLVVRAAAQAVAEERVRARADARAALPVVVACRDARALFDEVADALLAEGVSSGVTARRAFVGTAFGRAFLALFAFACDDAWRVAQASDFALSAFSGLGRRTAYELDAKWRGDRLVDRERVAADLAERSDLAAAALAALADGDEDGALAAFEARLRAAVSLDPAFRAEQLAAVACARRFAAACARCGVAFADALPLLERMQVPAGARTACDGAAASADAAGAEPDVRFLSLADAADLPSCSCATLVLCDLTASAYPVRAAEDGGTLLFEKLGLCRSADALADARRRFFRALSCARDAVVCERPLNTVDADEAYPAVMLEELLDCYRSVEVGAFAADVDRATGLPAPLAPHALVAGEEALHDNLALACGAARPSGEAASWDVPAAGEVSPAQRARIVLPRSSRAGLAADAPPVLSPSALESYLECPYKWFALRRLRLSEPDAGFGPAEMGSFSHGVLKSFYEHFQETGRRKVDEATLPEARALLRETFERHLAHQPASRHANALIPRTSFERAETNDLEKKLVAYLDREAALLPGFAPARFEFEFGGNEPFSYAGCLLRGSVDRIDVNERGQAVVIDYKGALKPDYALDSSSPAAQAAGAPLPHKVQALVYAQVARRVLGLEVVGALYVSYGRDGRVAGAFDRTAVGEQDVPGIDVERCGVPGPAAEALGAATFDELVDAVEERIAVAVRTLTGGDIAPDPRGGDPCGFCPVLACERRRAE